MHTDRQSVSVLSFSNEDTFVSVRAAIDKHTDINRIRWVLTLMGVMRSQEVCMDFTSCWLHFSPLCLQPQKPVALKAHREEMRGRIAGQRSRYTLQCDVIKSDSFSRSQVRTASTYRQCSVTWESTGTKVNSKLIYLNSKIDEVRSG